MYIYIHTHTHTYILLNQFNGCSSDIWSEGNDNQRFRRNYSTASMMNTYSR